MCCSEFLKMKNGTEASVTATPQQYVDNVKDVVMRFNQEYSTWNDSKTESNQSNALIEFLNHNKEFFACYESVNVIYLINVIGEIENSMLNIAIGCNKQIKESVACFDKKLQENVHSIRKASEKQMKGTLELSMNVSALFKAKGKRERKLEKKEALSKAERNTQREALIESYERFSSTLDIISETMNDVSYEEISKALNDELDKNSVDFIGKLKSGKHNVLNETIEEMKKIQSNISADIKEDVDELGKNIDTMIQENTATALDVEKEKELNKELLTKLEEAKAKKNEIIEKVIKESLEPMISNPRESNEYHKLKEELESEKQELQKMEELDYIISSPIEDIISLASSSQNEDIYCLNELRYLIKEKSINKENNAKQYSKELLDFNDPSLVIDESSLPIQVTGASLDTLAFLIFHPGNDDPLFNKTLALLVINSKTDLKEFFDIVSVEYDISQLDEHSKNEKLSVFMWELKQWFDVDYDAVTARFTSLYKDFKQPKFVHFFNARNLPYNDSSELLFATDPMILVHNITAYELELITNIPASEYKASEWTKAKKDVLTPNIVKVTNHFNAMSEYIQLSFANKATQEERIKVLERWIEVMICALKMNSFTLIFEISGSLNGKLLQCEELNMVSADLMNEFKRIDAICSPLKKFKLYNETIAKIKPEDMVPYIGVNLTNLVFIHDGNPLKVVVPSTGKEVFNFTKQRATAVQISFLKQHWGRNMSLFTKNEIIERIDKELSVPHLSEEQMNDLFAQISK